MFEQMKRSLLAVLALAALTGCAKMTLAWTNLEPVGPSATPPVLEGLNGDSSAGRMEAWEARAPSVREAVQREVYGFLPDASATRVVERRLLREDAFNGKGVLEEWTIAATATFNGVAVETKSLGDRGGFIAEIVLPAEAEGPVPIIIMETFCPWWDVVPDPAVFRPEDAGSMSEGFIGAVASYVFGRYICTPPFEMILDHGYGVAALYPEAVPDRREAGLTELRRLSEGYPDDETRWGAVAAWGWLFSRMVDALEDDPRVDDNAIIVWGHSRYAKSALVAAAFDDRIDGVISHQSGTGGASLNRGKKGESVKSITDSYPHWFSRTYAGFAGREGEMSIDQHHLLALVAPRPVLLGNARRDVWSDPNGAFRAAMGADPVYELYGGDGLVQRRLDEWKPDAELAFWVRPGTHGVVKEDWPAFLEFLDAHFGDGGQAIAVN